MKQLLLFIFLLAFYSTAISQITLTYNNRQFKVTQTSTVKDSAGNSYVYADWLNMLTSGEYSIKPVNPENSQTGFLLIKLSKEEQARRLADSPKPMESNGFMNKKKISPFTAQAMNGMKIDSKELKGKIVVLNFWFIRCPPCRMERPYLNQLVKEYANDKDVVFVAIALDNKADLEIFLKENPFDYHIIPDGGSIAKNNDVNQYPTHVIINKEGKIAFNSVSYSAVTGYWMRKTIEEIKNPH